MAEGLNRVTLLGQLGADPELKTLNGGQALLSLRLATNESYLDKNNERQNRTEWHRVSIWGRRAEALGKILNKGDTIYVEGRLQTRSYEKNGEKRYSTEIVATNVLLPGGRSGGVDRREASQSRSAPQQSGKRPAANGGGGGDDFGDFSGGGGGTAKSAGGDDDDIPF
jgi:single-strand DNA-binding protein